jgi:hypothetical protein
MHHRRQIEVALDALDDAQSLLPGGTARTVGHGAVVRTRGHQGGQGLLEQGALPLLGLGRKELDGIRRTAPSGVLPVDLVDVANHWV